MMDINRTRFCNLTKRWNSAANSSPDVETDYYDVINDAMQNISDAPPGVTPSRSLPPLPPSASDGYTKLNLFPVNELITAAKDGYENVLEACVEARLDAPEGLSVDPPVAQNVRGVGNDYDTRRNVAVVAPVPRVEPQQDDDCFDANGYLKLVHVPSTEDVSHIDDEAFSHKQFEEVSGTMDGSDGNAPAEEHGAIMKVSAADSDCLEKRGKWMDVSTN